MGRPRVTAGWGGGGCGDTGGIPAGGHPAAGTPHGEWGTPHGGRTPRGMGDTPRPPRPAPHPRVSPAPPHRSTPLLPASFYCPRAQTAGTARARRAPSPNPPPSPGDTATPRVPTAPRAAPTRAHAELGAAGGGVAVGAATSVPRRPGTQITAGAEATRGLCPPRPGTLGPRVSPPRPSPGPTARSGGSRQQLSRARSRTQPPSGTSRRWVARCAHPPSVPSPRVTPGAAWARRDPAGPGQGHLLVPAGSVTVRRPRGVPCRAPR